MRRLKLLTASKAELARKCLHWLNLDAEWNDRSSDKAEIGKMAHKEIEDAINLYLANDHSILDEPIGPYAMSAFRFLRTIHLEKVAKYCDTEMSFSFNGVTPVHIGKNRDYGGITDADTVAGTVDVVIRQPGTLIVIDWKTGDASKAYWQLVALAGLASGGYDDTDMVNILSVHVDKSDFSVAIDKWMSVGDAMAELRGLHERLATADTGKVVGPHCFGMYCPHAAACMGVDDE